MKYIIVMHNMSVEERGADNMVSEVDEDDAVIVGGKVTPMWSGLVRIKG